jgi:hypothetical protein
MAGLGGVLFIGFGILAAIESGDDVISTLTQKTCFDRVLVTT